MKKIDISTKKYPNIFALVDDEDYERINKYKWHTRKIHNVLYVSRTIYIKGFKPLRIDMHREIMRYVGDKVIDHINHNGLDNTKGNLRICTQHQNVMNKRIQSNNTSGYKGVWYRKDRGKWKAEIWLHGKKISLGHHTNKKAAAIKYNEAAIKLYGEYACLNEI